MQAALRSELFRAYKRGMPRILLGILAVVIFLLYLLFWASLESAQNTGSSEQTIEELRELITLKEVANGSGVGLVHGIAAIMATILGASIIATEYNWGTVRTMLPMTASRSAFVAAKLVVLTLFCFAITIVGMVAALLSSALVTRLAGLESDLGSNFVLNILRSVGAGFVAELPYVALAFMVALLMRSTAGGIGVALAVLFVEGEIATLLEGVGGSIETAAKLMLGSNSAAVIELADPDEGSTGEGLRGVALVLVYSAVFAAIALRRFSRRDVLLG